ncbi:MAG: winged helix DNA-binding domain-containing protein [Candidatus Bathyarchaeota archaeon]|nr:winged helix DNA-binding domain-containing protein [Candidatus Bathyarchaeota archaeon]
MRNTVHIVTKAQFPVIQAALRKSQLSEWNRWTVKTGSKESPDSWERFYDPILDALDTEPRSVAELMTHFGYSTLEEKIVLSRTVREMCLMGILCIAYSRGPWYRSRENAFARVDRWLPGVDVSLDEDEARRKLARWYLNAYGPASVQDFAYWTGMKISEARLITASLGSELVEVKITGQKRTCLLLEKDQDELQTDKLEGSVRLLPQFDALIMGHKDKTRFLDEEHRKNVFQTRSVVSATVLINGRVLGVWKILKSKKAWNLHLTPFHEFTENETDALLREINEMRGFTGFEIHEHWP